MLFNLLKGFLSVFHKKQDLCWWDQLRAEDQQRLHYTFFGDNEVNSPWISSNPGKNWYRLCSFNYWTRVICQEELDWCKKNKTPLLQAEATRHCVRDGGYTMGLFFDTGFDIYVDSGS